MKLSAAQLTELKEFSVAHYNDEKHRYDTFVECYDDTAWQELADGLADMGAIYDMMETLASIWNERQQSPEW